MKDGLFTQNPEYHLKYRTVMCEGYWQDDPQHLFDVFISLDSWDGVDDEDDQAIFYYMDGEPLTVGTVISDGFVITQVGEVYA